MSLPRDESSIWSVVIVRFRASSSSGGDSLRRRSDAAASSTRSMAYAIARSFCQYRVMEKSRARAGNLKTNLVRQMPFRDEAVRQHSSANQSCIGNRDCEV